MKHEIHTVTSVEIAGPYTLRLVFEDRTVQVVDFLPVLRGEVFAPLRDLVLFNQVKLDPEARTVVWPNGADFDPALLHDWPQHAEQFAERAKQWAQGDSRKVAESKSAYGSAKMDS